CLTAEGRVDSGATAELARRAAPLELTFHRAFDLVAEPERELEELVRLGFARVLTSGQAASALEGRERIASLVRAARGRISIVAAGGVRAENAAELVRATGVAELHFSAAERVESAMRHRNPAPRLAAVRPAENHAHWETAEERVRAVLRALDVLGARIIPSE